jgi:hypothetical protein
MVGMIDSYNVTRIKYGFKMLLGGSGDTGEAAVRMRRLSRKDGTHF